MDPLPFLVVVVPLIMGLSSIAVYRSIYPYQMVKEALETVAAYRALKARARSKRDFKKLASMESDYRRARRIMTRALILKMILLLASYTAGSLFVFAVIPFLPSPYYIPFLTVEAEGSYYVVSVTVYFLVYVILFITLRDSFL